MTVGVNVSGAEYSWMPFVGASDLDYLQKEGITLIRLPISWERMQPTLNGPLDPTYLAGLENVLTEAAARGIKVVVDLHNSGGYDANYAAQAATEWGVITQADLATSSKIGTSAVPISSFASLWSQLATQLKGHAGLAGYDIMNEPNSMPDATVWPKAAQAAVDAIRAVDMSTPIYVEGDQWATAKNWLYTNANLHITDPANKIIYEAHQYFDNGSGTYSLTYAQQGDTANTGVQDVQPFLDWLKANNYQGYLGELGVPNNDPSWIPLLNKTLSAVEAAGVSSTVWNYVYADPSGKNSWWPVADLNSIDPKMGWGAATMEAIFAHNAPTITGYSPSTTNVSQITLNGMAAVNSAVQIFDGSTQIGIVNADSTGSWSFATGALANAAHSFTATDRDAAGTVSAASAALNLTINAPPPPAPTVASFSPDSGVVGDGITNVNQLTLTGTAPAGDTVEVFDGTTQIGNATANSSGAWSFATATLSDGSHAFTGKAMDAAGNISTASAALNVTIDTVAPGAPHIISDAPASATALIVTGTAEAGSTVKLFNGTTLLGAGVADTSGSWNINTGPLSPGTQDFTATATDAAGNVSSVSNVLDPVIGPTPVVIESFGSTSLVEVGNNFYFDSNSTGAGPELKFAGAAVVAGQLGAWAPIGVEQTLTGYEVAWKVTGADQYGIWNTDSNGNYVSNTDVVSGTSAMLESFETSFHQDLNGDGVIGPPSPQTSVIESSGSTSLVEVGNNYYFYSNSTGAGPELKFAGAAVVAGQLGAWAPIGVEQTLTGYEVAWKVAGADEYGVWNTDSNGNYVSNTAVVSGTSAMLEAYEISFHQDLNGDGVIGTPPLQTSALALSASTSPVQTPAIESSGSTSLVQVDNNFYLDNTSTGSGPEIKFAGAAVVAGEFGAWTPIAVEQTATGYDVAWKIAGVDEYGVWYTDSSGNFISNTAVVSGNSSLMDSFESIFHQDLNGDGIINTPSTVIEATGNVLLTLSNVTQAATIDAGSSLELTGADSGTVKFSGVTGTLVLDNSSLFTGQILNLTGDGNPSSSDQIDLKDISFGAGTTYSYAGNASGGILTIRDAQNDVANLSLVGNYTNSTFTLSSDGHGGTIAIDPPKDGFHFASTPAVTTGSTASSVTLGGAANDAFIFHTPPGGASATPDSVALDGSGSPVESSHPTAPANDAQSYHQGIDAGHDAGLDHSGSANVANAHVAWLHDFMIH
ncbi:Tryptophan-rich Synechocystis species C-terminal domain-containing protein [Bradyrhizobium lablabi]|uniref:Tryptophan-rich Synechocystis species C-terminal domain-containing protein n=1 Tax=Bradyrhizobium lablabi TaxID=722472 RepID=A0A1M6MN58_9BRAD|nr:cellulase family glycosylhydrolase [Bradyrhizobium lablabi]SHJ84911.1 Tryptophan-rich Synechocystis species C-terminal domain-containing protein [Bradyrhizobium lablabi]